MTLKRWFFAIWYGTLILALLLTPAYGVNRFIGYFRISNGTEGAIYWGNPNARIELERQIHSISVTAGLILVISLVISSYSNVLVKGVRVAIGAIRHKK